MSLNALYVDFNSYFASVEQQLVPEYRGKPIGVLAVMAETTCCIAASNEAKQFGIKTGTGVRDARKLCAEMIFVQARPPLYIEYHHKLIEIVESCTHVEKVLSIDEMVCKLTGSQQQKDVALKLAAKIKREIHKQYPFIHCSIGIAPNTFLAKLASNMQKPNGCVVIEQQDIPEKLYGLKPRDLTGIGRRMEERLNHYGLTTMQALYAANKQQLRAAWGSVEGERMYDKLRGIEIIRLSTDRKSLGHSHVLPPELRTQHGALSVLHRLLQKACVRLRSYQLRASKIHVRVKFTNHPTWVIEANCSPTDNTSGITHIFETLWAKYPAKKVVPQAVGISFSNFINNQEYIVDLFEANVVEGDKKLNTILDKLNNRYGKNTIYLGGAHNALYASQVKIAFNYVPDLVVEN
ncbi:MAG: DNA polymerase [Pseudomonadota bacterium]